MRVYLDAQALQSQSSARRGIARYVAELVAALCDRHPDRVAAIGHNPLLPPPDAAHRFAQSTEPNTSASFRRHCEEAQDLGTHLAYHVLSPFEVIRPVQSFLPRHVMVSGAPLVVTCYDLIPLAMPSTYLPRPEDRRFYRRRLQLLAHADAVVTISEFARRDLLDHVDVDPGRVHVVGAGVSEFFTPSPPDTPTVVPPSVPGIARPFVLSVTGDDPRKNTVGLLDAWAALRPDVRRDHQLVITGRAAAATVAAWQEHAHARGLRPDDVVFTGYVDDHELRALYRACDLFVFASLAEGFGLPAVEAARCGAAVLTSDTTGLGEVLDHPPATFPPHEPAAIATTIERGLGDPAFRTELRGAAARAAERHSWAKVADRTTTAYDTLDHRPARPPRPRIAVVGDRHDAAPHAARAAALVSRLVHAADVHCLDVPRLDRSRGAGALQFPLAALGRTLNPASYDAVVVVRASGATGLPPAVASWVTLTLAPLPASTEQAAALVLAHATQRGAARRSPSEAPAAGIRPR